jgi:hypothetical protein
MRSRDTLQYVVELCASRSISWIIGTTIECDVIKHAVLNIEHDCFGSANGRRPQVQHTACRQWERYLLCARSMWQRTQSANHCETRAHIYSQSGLMSTFASHKGSHHVSVNTALPCMDYKKFHTLFMLLGPGPRPKSMEFCLPPPCEPQWFPKEPSLQGRLIGRASMQTNWEGLGEPALIVLTAYLRQSCQCMCEASSVMVCHNICICVYTHTRKFYKVL